MVLAATGSTADEAKVGRQINFYLSDGDQEELCRRLDVMGEVLAVMPPFSQPRVDGQAVLPLSRWRPGEHTPMLFRPDDRKKLVFRRSVPGYFVDDMRSPVVEFSRCVTTNDVIRRGRLYYIAEYFNDENQKISKDPDFINWAKKLFKMAKGVCVESRDGVLIGKEAQYMARLGYRFESS